MTLTPHKSTYTVTVKIEDGFTSEGPCHTKGKPQAYYVARDAQRNWRTYWKVSRANAMYPDGITPSQLIEGLFHADEVESFTETNGIITAIIRQW